MDFFEESFVERKKTPQDVMSIIVAFMAAFIALYLILIQFNAGKLVILIPLEIAFVIFAVFVVISAFKVEYEYSVTNGDLDIDKIVAKRRRTRLITVNLRDVEYFALLDDTNISVAEDKSINRVIDATSTIDSLNVYFAIFYVNNEKICLLFEPTEGMVNNFANYVPRSLNHTI